MSEPRPAETPRRDALPFLVLGGLVAAFLWDAVVARSVFVMRDTVFEFLPWRRFAAEAAREGSVPLWNPYSRFGQPFVANPQSAFFYPPHHVFDVLPVAWAFPLLVAFHLFVAAAGMFALLRRFRLAGEAALLGGIAFAFGTYFTANLEFMSVMDTLAWAPLTILLVCRAADAWDAGPSQRLRRAAPHVVLLALAVAFQIAAGQAQVLALTALAALVLGVAVPAAEGRRGAAVAAPVALAAAGVLAVLFALVQVLPTLELLPHSVRATSLDPGLDIASMAPRHLATLVLPLAFGRPGGDAWWGTTLFEFWLGCVHIGLAPLVCVTFAALPRPGTSRVPARIAAASAALCVLGILIAMGRYTPVYEALQAIPGAGKFRWPAKGLQLVALGLPVLAAVGLDTLIARREAAAGRADRGAVALLAAWGAVAVILLVAGAALGRGLFERLAGQPLPESAGTATFLTGDLRRSVVVLLLSVAALGALASRAVPRRFAAGLVLGISFIHLLLVSRDVQFVGDTSLLTPPPPRVGAPPGPLPGHVRTAYSLAAARVYGSHDADAYALGAELLTGEVGMDAKLSRTYGGDALQIRDAVEIADLAERLPDAQRERLLDVLAVDRDLRGPAFEDLLAARTQAPAAAPRPRAVPRAFLVDRWQPVADKVDAVRRLLDPSFDIRREVVVDPASGAPPLPPPPGSGMPLGRVAALEHGRDRAEVRVEVERPCLLVLCDTWFPGWTARVDGAERGIQRVNTIFRGVLLAPGDRVVEFRYEPASFRTGAAGSVVALAAGVALALWGRRVRA